MALNVSAFTPVRHNSISSDDSDAKTSIHYPETSYSSPYVPWWRGDSSAVNTPLWSWWGLQNRFSNFYRFPHYSGATDDEKPSQSYIGLIAEAILSSPEEKLILSDIYGFILSSYPYFRNKGTGWRNSIRHNLSLNDCFIKAGRSQNGKGHFWAISPLFIDDFRRGDFRRKRTYRRPSRGKKARAKLEAMKRKAVLELAEINETEKNERKLYKDETLHRRRTQEELCEQLDDRKVMTEAKVEGKREEFIVQELCGDLMDHKADERVVPSSPEWSPETEYQEIDVCTTENDHKETSHKHNEEQKTDEMKIEELRARRTKAFDMDALLATDRSRELGILREMYPMYYNIMNIGMRSLDTMDIYGPSHPYCGCSMIGSPFPSHHRELRRPMPSMASYGTVLTMQDEYKREYME